MLFRQLRAAMKAQLGEELARAGHELNFSQYITLHKLAAGPCGASEAARAAELNPGAMTRLIDTLAKRGLVERLPDPHDRRAQQIRLTAHGQRIWQDINACGMRMRERALTGFSDAERGQMLHLLERVRDNLAPSESC